MATSNDDVKSTGRTRARIVREKQATVHEARSNYRRMVSGGAGQTEIDAAAADLHAAVMDYWDALKPLSDEDVIADEWTDGPVYHEQVPKVYQDGQVRLETEPGLEGWDNVEQFQARSETHRTTQRGFFGAQTNETTQPQRLPPRILIEMSFRLDEMASELGFKPDVPDKDPQTEVTQKTVERARERLAEWVEEHEEVDVDA